MAVDSENAAVFAVCRSKYGSLACAKMLDCSRTIDCGQYF